MGATGDVDGGRPAGMRLTDLARWMSEGPAQLAGCGARKGRIAPAYDADFIVFDPEREFHRKRRPACISSRRLSVRRRKSCVACPWHVPARANVFRATSFQDSPEGSRSTIESGGRKSRRLVISIVMAGGSQTITIDNTFR